jgi:hypothetical protein
MFCGTRFWAYLNLMDASYWGVLCSCLMWVCFVDESLSFIICWWDGDASIICLSLVWCILSFLFGFDTLNTVRGPPRSRGIDSSCRHISERVTSSIKDGYDMMHPSRYQRAFDVLHFLLHFQGKG